MNIEREKEFVHQFHYDARNLAWEEENGTPETALNPPAPARRRPPPTYRWRVGTSGPREIRHCRGRSSPPATRDLPGPDGPRARRPARRQRLARCPHPAATPAWC